MAKTRKTKRRSTTNGGTEPRVVVDFQPTDAELARMAERDDHALSARAAHDI